MAALLLTAAGLNLLVQRAAADDPIALEIPDCAGVSVETVRGIVALEVAPRTVLEAGSSAPAATRGVLSCEDGIARITVEDAAMPAPLRLDLELDDHAPAARPRLLALAIAELIATSRLGRLQPSAADDEPKPPPEPQLEAAESSVDAPSEPMKPTFQLWLAAAAVREADPAVLAPSVALGAVQSWGWLAIALDARYERGERTEPAVRLGMDVGSFAVGPAWRLHDRSYQLLLGPAVRLGYANLRGAARTDDLEGDSVAGLWFGPCAQAALQFRVSTRWSVRVGAELGYVARGVRGLGASEETLFALRGLWFTALLGISVDLLGDG